MIHRTTLVEPQRMLNNASCHVENRALNKLNAVVHCVVARCRHGKESVSIPFYNLQHAGKAKENIYYFIT